MVPVVVVPVVVVVPMMVVVVLVVQARKHFERVSFIYHTFV